MPDTIAAFSLRGRAAHRSRGQCAIRRGVEVLLLIGGVALWRGCIPPQGNETSLDVELIAAGFTAPVALVAPPDGSDRLFVVDQPGLIHILDAARQRSSTPFLDLTDRIIPLGGQYEERGLLGLAFHPQYATNGRLFVVYNAPPDASGGSANNEWRLAEFQVDPGNAERALPESERILLRVAMHDSDRLGGQLAFGPDDGWLYISVGDGGETLEHDAPSQPAPATAQDLNRLQGKLLRIDVDADSGVGYAIPPDNPFVGQAGARPEIWASGLRNPWRFSFDTAADHRLITADVGQRLFEEVDIISAGGNYGWPIREGFSCYDINNPSFPLQDCAGTAADGAPLIDPIISLAHLGDGITAVVGGFIYRGQALPQLTGDYIFGSYTTSRLSDFGRISIAHQAGDGSWVVTYPVRGSAAALERRVLAFGQDAAGEIYVLTSRVAGASGTTGEVLRLVPGP